MNATQLCNEVFGQWVSRGTSIANTILVSGGAVPLVTTGQDVNRPFDPVTALIAPGVVLQAHINVSATQNPGDYFIHLSSGGTTNFLARVSARAQGNGFQLALGTSSDPPLVTSFDSVLSFN